MASTSMMVPPLAPTVATVAQKGLPVSGKCSSKSPRKVLSPAVVEGALGVPETDNVVLFFL